MHERSKHDEKGRRGCGVQGEGDTLLLVADRLDRKLIDLIDRRISEQYAKCGIDGRGGVISCFESTFYSNATRTK